jgi:DNA-directed RNA polymerase alpha subunit
LNPETDRHLEGLKQLVDEHRLLNQQNRALTQENFLLKNRIEAMAAHARAIVDLCSDAPVNENKELPAIFKQAVEEPDFSVRLYNCLKNANLITIGEVVQKTEAEILRSRNFGRKATNELKGVLATQGLRLGMTEMDMLAWIPPDPANPLFRQP